MAGRWSRVKLTRRGLIRSGAVAGGAAAAAGCRDPRRCRLHLRAQHGRPPPPAPPHGPPSARTLARGDVGAGRLPPGGRGNRRAAPGSHRPRPEAVARGAQASQGAARLRPAQRRAHRRRPVAAARGVHRPVRRRSAAAGDRIFASAYRPTRCSPPRSRTPWSAAERVGAGPVTGQPLALAIQTGDNSDNSQFNEIRWNIDSSTAASCAPTPATTPAGRVSRTTTRPTTTRTTGTRTARRGQGRTTCRAASAAFRRFPACSMPLVAPSGAQGLPMPWYATFGNHDGLVQGTSPPNPAAQRWSPPGPSSSSRRLPAFARRPSLDALRRRPRGPCSPPSRSRPSVRGRHPRRRAAAAHPAGRSSRSTSTPPACPAATASPPRTGPRARPTTPSTRGACRFVVLDTVNPNGYDDGSLDQPQFDWLKATLVARRTGSSWSSATTPPTTMDNPLVGTGADVAPRVLGDAVSPTCSPTTHVVAWINGHTHKNQIWPHARVTAGAGSGRSTPPPTSTGPRSRGSSRSPTTATAPCRSSPRSSTTPARRRTAETPAPATWPAWPASSPPTTGTTAATATAATPQARNVELVLPAPALLSCLDLASRSAASWPQAPSISRPRVSRTVVGMPLASSRRTNSRSSAGSDAVHFEPGVGLSGIRFTCTQPQSPSPAARRRAGRRARPGR